MTGTIGEKYKWHAVLTCSHVATLTLSCQAITRNPGQRLIVRIFRITATKWRNGDVTFERFRGARHIAGNFEESSRAKSYDSVSEQINWNTFSILQSYFTGWQSHDKHPRRRLCAKFTSLILDNATDSLHANAHLVRYVAERHPLTDLFFRAPSQFSPYFRTRVATSRDAVIAEFYTSLSPRENWELSTNSCTYRHRIFPVSVTFLRVTRDALYSRYFLTSSVHAVKLAWPPAWLRPDELFVQRKSRSRASVIMSFTWVTETASIRLSNVHKLSIYANYGTPATPGTAL